MRTSTSLRKSGPAATAKFLAVRPISVAAALLLALLIAGLIRSRALAGSSVGSFEIDGDLTVEHAVPPAEPIDWDSSPFPAALTTFTDGTGPTDDIFGLGSKENEQSTWVCTTGSAPAKDDIVNEISINGAAAVAGEVAFRFVGSDQFIYADWSRLSNNGDAHIDYEFNQADPSTSPASPGCTQLPRRTPGDFLISFDTQFGGKIINVSAFTWTGTTFVSLPVGSQGNLWDAAVNSGPTTGLQVSGTNVANLFGELALNVSKTIGTIPCNAVLNVSMKTRSSTSLSAELKDRTKLKPVNFTIFNPAGAHASGNAFGAQVTDTLLGLNQTLPTPVPASSQTGVGSSSASNQVLAIDLPPPPPGSDLHADVLRASSTGTVDATTNTATDTSVAESAGVNVLSGVITASVVRAVAQAKASGDASSFSAAGSAFQNLVVAGVAMNNVTPNTRVDLPAAVFGAGSFVTLFEETGATAQPPPGVIMGGTFAADLTVNMIHVHVSGAAGGVGAAEIIVSHATAHADFPQPAGCPALAGSVSGNATIVNEQMNPSQLPVVVGLVSLPPQGGHDHQDLDQVSTAAVSAGTSVSDTAGTVGAATSTAASSAQAQNLCLLPTGGVCTVAAASAVTSQDSSTAGGGTASSNDTGTSLVGLSVMGGPPTTVTPPPNTTIPLSGIGFVTLNEQFCDGSATLPTCAATGSPAHSGRTVRAIHLVVTNPNALGVPQGANIIVGEAHSDATH